MLAQGGGDRFGHVDGLTVDRQRADLQSAGVEQVADQTVQAIGFLVDGDERLANLLGAPVHVGVRATPRPSP